MEYSELVLIALVLLIVFFGAQIPKVVELLRSSQNEKTPTPVKTILSAEKTVEMPRKKSAPVTKKVVKKATKRKTSATKKTSNKKKTVRK